jgi:hypothetical protein
MVIDSGEAVDHPLCHPEMFGKIASQRPRATTSSL